LKARPLIIKMITFAFWRLMSKVKENQLRRRREARKRQLTILGGVVVAGLVIIGISVGWSAYENSKPVGAIIPIERDNYKFANGKTLGAETAKVTIDEFADFQCPICGEFAAQTEPDLIANYMASGQVRYVFHHFIVIDGNVGGTESRRAAEASECANEQGQFWDYHKLVYHNQAGEGKGAFTDRRLKAFAETLGLDTAKFNQCFDSGKYAQNVLADEREGRSLGVNGTPSIFVNGRQVQATLADIQQAVDAALAASN
jgi:protein-disulfide isomerase